MFRWSDLSDNESKIIEQFKFFQEHLTAESAAQFCTPHNCGFLFELYKTDHLHCQGAFQSYLICLRVVAPLVSRHQFLSLFSKSCSACGILQILCILYMHPVLENEVNDLFRELLCDPRGDILHRNDIHQLAIMIRQAYKRRDYPFPYIGSCTDFESDSQGCNKVKAIGRLWLSDEFRQLMKSDPVVGAQIAHKMMKNYRYNDYKSDVLCDLLANYQEFIFANKSAV